MVYSFQNILIFIKSFITDRYLKYQINPMFSEKNNSTYCIIIIVNKLLL